MPHGDGWLRSFDAQTGKLIWKCDANPKDSKHELAGGGTKNEFMATPVWHDGRIYIATGQEPEHYLGARLAPVHRPLQAGRHQFRAGGRAGQGQTEPELRRDLGFGGRTNKVDRVRLAPRYYYGRTLSNCVVHDGLVYATELNGYLHCLDAKTGKGTGRMTSCRRLGFPFVGRRQNLSPDRRGRHVGFIATAKSSRNRRIFDGIPDPLLLRSFAERRSVRDDGNDALCDPGQEMTAHNWDPVAGHRDTGRKWGVES